MLNKMLRLFRRKNERLDEALRKSILIIDDGEVERKFISTSLRKHGYQTLTASNGEAGIELAHTNLIDLILLDYMMPGLNGKDVCLRLKQDGRTRDIPVIFLTDSTQPKDIVGCYEAGAEYFLNKPITARLLIKQVGMILADFPRKS